MLPDQNRSSVGNAARILTQSFREHNMPQPTAAPIIDLILRSGFDPDTTNAMVIAFKDVVLDFGLSEEDPRAEIVARKVIECAKLGERNPVRLREIVAKSLQGWPPQ
jgi:hypothetical protein